MKDTSTQKSERKKDWELTQSAFRHLLDWFDEGVESGGEKYMEMRRRLVSYFDRKNCLSPDDLADETLNRVARRLEEEGSITNAPAHYCYIVAKFVHHEYLRWTERSHLSIDEPKGFSPPGLNPKVVSEERLEAELKEKRLSCLERCLQKLEPDNRELISHYYQGDQRAKIENRRDLAARAGLTMNALGIRACRIRGRLEACVSKCSEL